MVESLLTTKIIKRLDCLSLDLGLGFAIHDDQSRAAQDLIHAAGTSLRSLRLNMALKELWDHPSHPLHKGTLIDIRADSGLEELYLTLCHHKERIAFTPNLDFLLSFASPCLMKLTVEFRLLWASTAADVSSGITKLDSQFCKQLNELLGFPAFGSLQEVRLSVCPDSSVSINRMQYANLLELCLHNAKQRGIAGVTVASLLTYHSTS